MSRNYAQEFRDLMKANQPAPPVIKKTVQAIQEQGLQGFFEEVLPGLRNLCLSPLERLAREMEELPINQENLADYQPMFFALVQGEWIPAYNGEDQRNENGFCTLGIRYKNSSTETLACAAGSWADCNADGLPSMPFIGEE